MTGVFGDLLSFSFYLTTRMWVQKKYNYSTPYYVTCHEPCMINIIYKQSTYLFTDLPVRGSV